MVESCSVLQWIQKDPQGFLKATEEGTDLNLKVDVPDMTQGASTPRSLRFKCCTPLQYACVKGDLALIQRLLELGADPNWSAYGLSPLSSLTRCDEFVVPNEVLELASAALVNYGADLNGPASQPSPLMHACDAKSTDCFRFFLNLGASLAPEPKRYVFTHCKMKSSISIFFYGIANAKGWDFSYADETKTTALIQKCKYPDPTNFMLGFNFLLEKTKDVDHACHNGRTALHYAAMNFKENYVKKLIQAGATNTQDVWGTSVVEAFLRKRREATARERKHCDVIEAIFRENHWME